MGRLLIWGEGGGGGGGLWYIYKVFLKKYGKRNFTIIIFTIRIVYTEGVGGGGMCSRKNHRKTPVPESLLVSSNFFKYVRPFVTTRH